MAIAPGWCPVGHPRGHGGLGDDWGSGGRRGWGVWSCVASTGGGAWGQLRQLGQQALGGAEGDFGFLQQLGLLGLGEIELFKGGVQLIFELPHRPLEGPEAHGRQAPAGQNGIGLLGQLLTAGEVAAVAHVHMGQEAMRFLAGEGAQVLEPVLGGRRGRRGRQARRARTG